MSEDEQGGLGAEWREMRCRVGRSEGSGYVPGGKGSEGWDLLHVSRTWIPRDVWASAILGDRQREAAAPRP